MTGRSNSFSKDQLPGPTTLSQGSKTLALQKSSINGFGSGTLN